MLPSKNLTFYIEIFSKFSFYFLLIKISLLNRFTVDALFNSLFGLDINSQINMNDQFATETVRLFHERGEFSLNTISKRNIN